METETQDIEKAIADLGLTMESKCIDPCIAGQEMKNGSKWSVTISREGNGSYTTTYSMGAAYRKWKTPIGRNYLLENGSMPEYPKYREMRDRDLKNGGKLSQGSCSLLSRLVESNKFFGLWTDPTAPDLPGVLYCLVSDAQCVCCGQTFDEFCSDLGYDEDSRKAERIYNACRDTHYALIRMGLDMEMLSELFQDY